MGIVGESGSGKSTLGLALLRLISAQGRVRFGAAKESVLDSGEEGWGEDILTSPRSRMRELRREMQIVFQDPFSSLSPRLSVADIIAEGPDIHGFFARELLVYLRLRAVCQRLACLRIWAIAIRTSFLAVSVSA